MNHKPCKSQKLFFLSCLVAAFLTASLPGLASDTTPIEIADLKPLFPRTALVTGGRPAALIVPGSTDALMQQAKALRDTLARRTGAALHIVPAEDLVDAGWRVDHDRIGARNLIALGNVNDNRLMSVLYGGGYLVSDAIYPGPEGYVIRTVHDPFAVGINVLALAGSDAAGVANAVAVFSDQHLPRKGNDAVLEQPLVRVVFRPVEYRFYPGVDHYLSQKRQPQYTKMAWFREYLQNGGFMDEAGHIIQNTRKGANLVSVVGSLARLGQTYFRTGNTELLTLMKQLVSRNLHLLGKPARLQGMGGRSAGAVHAWDLLEELPMWTDEERLAVTNALLRDARIGHERRGFHQQVREGAVQAMDENHGTVSALNSFRAWHYFQKYYRLPESDYWMRCARAVFSAQASTFQILEDASSYLCACPRQTVDYALQSRDLDYMTRGIARHHAHYIALACINNLGLGTGFGDSPGLILQGAFEAIAPAAWFYRDPYLNWVVQNGLPRDAGLRIFQSSIAMNLEAEAREPAAWTGVTRWPLFEAPLKKGQATDTPVFAPKKDLVFSRFNKLIFKENWSRDGQYMLLDGAGAWGDGDGPHGHKHTDINTILNMTALGRMWLVDHTYERRAFQDHSGVMLMRKGKGAFPDRTLAMLCNLLDGDEVAMTRSRLGNWERGIFWKKGDYFVVLDRVTAAEDGPHFARATFRTLGSAALSGRTLTLSQAHPDRPEEVRHCRFVSDGSAGLDTETFRFTNSEWGRFYPYAKPVATVLHEDKAGVLRAGQTITFLNLLYPYAEAADSSDVRMLAVTDSCARVDGPGDAMGLMGSGAIPGEAGRAEMFFVRPGRMWVSGTRSLAGDVLQADAPCNLSVDTKRETLVVACRQPVVLSFVDRPKEILLEGKAIAVTREDGRWQTPLKAGKWTLRLRGWRGFETISRLIRASLSQSEEMAQTRSHVAPKSDSVRAKDIALQPVVPNVDVRTILSADLDGDGGEELLLGTDDGVGVYGADGTLRWTYRTGGPVRALDVGNTDGDGKADVAVGCDNTFVYLLDNEGEMVWRSACKASEDALSGPPAVDFVAIADLENDGKAEVVAGANWIHVFNADGSVKWERYMILRRGRITGDFACGAVADLDGDGSREVVGLFVTSYPLIQGFNAAGVQILPTDLDHENHPGINMGVPMAVAAVDLSGSGRHKQIVSLEDRRIGFYLHDQKGRKRGQSGGEVAGNFARMAVYRPAAEGPPTIVAATTTCDLFAITARQQPDSRAVSANAKWLANLGEKATALFVDDLDSDGRPEIYAGTKQGNLRVFNLEDGQEIGHAHTADAPVSGFARHGKDLLVTGRGVWRIHLSSY